MAFDFCESLIWSEIKDVYLGLKSFQFFEINSIQYVFNSSLVLKQSNKPFSLLSYFYFLQFIVFKISTSLKKIITQILF